jgi:ABC-2 type transport system ATP-binding protein
MLNVENLKKSYGEIDAVKGVNINVAKGEIIGLLGPNGAGKSTIISMISTLIKPDSGTIEFKGKSVLSKPKDIQKVLGIVPQDIALYPTLTGYENLKFWGSAYGLKGKKLKKRIEEVSEIIEIKERLKDNVEKYSGGMKRRLNIGAALLHNPEFLIMDEPTVGIDPQSRNHILETIKELNKQGTTIIYTSHYMEEVEFLCDRIYIMDEGVIIAEGTKDQLVELIHNERNIIIEYENKPNGIKDKIRNLDSVIELNQNDKTLILKSKADINLMRQIIEISNLNKMDIISVNVEKPNLEAVFLKLTGKALRD